MTIFKEHELKLKKDPADKLDPSKQPEHVGMTSRPLDSEDQGVDDHEPRHLSDSEKERYDEEAGK